MKSNLWCLYVNLLVEEMFKGTKFDFVAFAKTMNIYYFLYSGKLMLIKFPWKLISASMGCTNVCGLRPPFKFEFYFYTTFLQSSDFETFVKPIFTHIRKYKANYKLSWYMIYEKESWKELQKKFVENSCFTFYRMLNF